MKLAKTIVFISLTSVILYLGYVTKPKYGFAEVVVIDDQTTKETCFATVKTNFFQVYVVSNIECRTLNSAQTVSGNQVVWESKLVKVVVKDQVLHTFDPVVGDLNKYDVRSLYMEYPVKVVKVPVFY